MSEQGYYDAAQKSLKYGNFDTATKHLEALESHYPVGVYTEQAQLDVIYAHYKHLDYAGAVVAAERFMRLHPLNPQIDYAYYLRALANFEADKDAFLRFIPFIRTNGGIIADGSTEFDVIIVARTTTDTNNGKCPWRITTGISRLTSPACPQSKPPMAQHLHALGLDGAAPLAVSWTHDFQSRLNAGVVI